MAGGVMPKMVIEVPEEFREVGKAEHLAALQRTVSRLGGGKAVDYAEIECCGGNDWRGALHAGGTVRGALPHDGGFSLRGEIVVPCEIAGVSLSLLPP